MRLFLLFTLLLAGCFSTPKVVKVLPHFLDHEGRIALDPSLYERDAYQAQLRVQPAERSGLQVELRGSLSNRVTTARLELPVQPSSPWSRWSKTSLSGDAYTRFGELSAWRVTLWKGEAMVADQRSFLW